MNQIERLEELRGLMLTAPESEVTRWIAVGVGIEREETELEREIDQVVSCTILSTNPPDRSFCSVTGSGHLKRV